MAIDNACWVGIDWGESEHAVHVLGPTADAEQCFVVEHSAKGLHTLVERLSRLCDINGIAVEASHNLLMTALLEAQLPVYAINPKVSAIWREAYSVSAAKSDGGDARILAHGLGHHYAHLPRLRVGDESIGELQMLCDDEVGFIEQRTALVQQLQAALKRYHPYMLVLFSDWTSPTAWTFLKKCPTPDKLVHTKKETLCKLLKANRIGMSPLWQQRIDGRIQALDWPNDAAQTAALSRRALSIVAMLQKLNTVLRDYRKRIEKLFGQYEHAEVFKSLPGAGVKLAPRLAVMLNALDEDSDDAAVLRQLSGVAPVTKQSGKKSVVIIRRACRKRWRNCLHLFAQLSKAKSLWARAFYKMCRERGNTHASALRKLAYKWLNIIYRMWKTKTVYNEEKYLKQLRDKQTPTWKYMQTHGYI